MSTVVARAPATTARPPRGWSFRGLYRGRYRRRRARGIFVAIVHAADVYPPG
ncbi:MAG: hypothetical protein ACRDL2_00735 [Gaiellaceae bacterium]